MLGRIMKAKEEKSAKSLVRGQELLGLLSDPRTFALMILPNMILPKISRSELSISRIVTAG